MSLCILSIDRRHCVTLWLKAEEQKRVIHWQTSFYALDTLRTPLSF